MENTKEEMKNFFTGRNINNFQEKRAIVYLVILTILIVYFSLFAIHNIVEKETIKDSKSSTIVIPDNGDNNNGNNNGNKNGNNNNNNNGNGSGDNSNKGDGSGNNDVPVVDNGDRFRIYEGAKEWSELKELSIFNNSYFNGEAKIAPGVSGTYNFTVENFGNTKMKYDIDFTDENPYNINLKFKIKYNGNYVAGNETTWADYNAMDQVNREINAGAKDLYTIEWKWVDAPNDTEVGEADGSYYKLHVKAYAEEI